MAKRFLLLFCGVAASFAGAPNLTAAAEKFAAAKPAYVKPDDSVSIVGSDEMAALLAGLNEIVSKEQPGLKFDMLLKGSSTALPALAAGKTLVAAMGREGWKVELGAFKQIHGYQATPIRIGYSGWGPRPNGKTPPAVYINASNPTPQMSVGEICGATVAGEKGGDVNTWGQLGQTGEAAERRVHVYGLRDNGGFATAFRDRLCEGLPFSAKYEPLETKEAVIRAVAADPYGIGIIGWFETAKVSGNVRILALTGKAEKPALPSREDVAAGHYPMTQAVTLYIDKAPGKPVDPLVKAYLKAALSDAGQALIGVEADKETGYLPLNAADLAAERAKAEAL